MECFFEWSVMPFRLTNPPTIFMMDAILHTFTNPFVFIYLDDIFIYKKMWEEHLQHIQHVLITLQHHKLYANI